MAKGFERDLRQADQLAKRGLPPRSGPALPPKASVES